MNYKITILNVLGFFIGLYGLVGLIAWLYNRVVYNDASTDVTMEYVPAFIIISIICFALDYLLQKVVKINKIGLNIIGLVAVIGLIFLARFVF